jgi:hypothetical protein
METDENRKAALEELFWTMLYPPMGSGCRGMRYNVAVG